MFNDDTHLDTPHSAPLFLNSDRPVEDTSTWQRTQHSQETDFHALSMFELARGRTHTYALKRAASLKGLEAVI